MYNITIGVLDGSRVAGLFVLQAGYVDHLGSLYTARTQYISEYQQTDADRIHLFPHNTEPQGRFYGLSTTSQPTSDSTTRLTGKV